MMSCRRASELTAIAMVRPLAFGESLSLRFHRMICSSCRRFAKQSDEINAAAGEWLGRDDEPDSGPPMPTAARGRIADRIERDIPKTGR